MNVDVDARGDATRDDARLTRMTTMTTRRVDVSARAVGHSGGRRRERGGTGAREGKTTRKRRATRRGVGERFGARGARETCVFIARPTRASSFAPSAREREINDRGLTERVAPTLFPLRRSEQNSHREAREGSRAGGEHPSRRAGRSRAQGERTGVDRHVGKRRLGRRFGRRRRRSRRED